MKATGKYENTVGYGQFFFWGGGLAGTKNPVDKESMVITGYIEIKKEQKHCNYHTTQPSAYTERTSEI